MIRKLRIKLLVFVMLSLLLMMAVRIVSTNWICYREIKDGADRIISGLQEENTGMEQAEYYRDLSRKLRVSPEAFYEARYFNVHIGKDGSIKEIDLDHIASVDNVRAECMTKDVLLSNKTKGYKEGFRYHIIKNNEDTTVFFFDCGRELHMFWRNIYIQVIITLLGFIVVSIIIFFFSKRLLRPVEDSYAKQKQFIAMAGHELKTPLTIIDADSELLRMELPEGNEWLEDISVQTKRLANLTNDLISLAKLEEVNTDITKIEFPLSDVVEETIQSFRAVAEQQKLIIHTNIEPMISYVGDEKLIRQLVGLIVDNALKYAMPQEPVDISLERKQKDVTFRVANYTEWITNMNISNIFDRFYRSDMARQSIKNGYGLGLAIAKRIIEAHEGKITADLLQGNIFVNTVVLPIKSS